MVLKAPTAVQRASIILDLRVTSKVEHIRLEGI